MKPASELTDEELFDELRDIVNQSRNTGVHDRDRAREIGEELRKRLDQENGIASANLVISAINFSKKP